MHIHINAYRHAHIRTNALIQITIMCLLNVLYTYVCCHGMARHVQDGTTNVQVLYESLK